MKSRYSIALLRTLTCAFALSVAVASYASANTESNTPEKPETVTIGGESYPIPAPWTGNRIPAPKFEFEDFGQIPVDHTKNGSRLYITAEAQQALIKLLNAAKEDGLVLRIESGYRSPGYQKRIFLKMIEEGRTFDDIIRYVAPPYYSEHARGTAVDFYPSNWRFAELPDYTWLRNNAADFGFTETYPEHNKLKYPWESWHWNYNPPEQ